MSVSCLAPKFHVFSAISKQLQIQNSIPSHSKTLSCQGGQANLQPLTTFCWSVGKTLIMKYVKSRIGLPWGPCYEWGSVKGPLVSSAAVQRRGLQMLPVELENTRLGRRALGSDLSPESSIFPLVKPWGVAAVPADPLQGATLALTPTVWSNGLVWPDYSVLFALWRQRLFTGSSLECFLAPESLLHFLNIYSGLWH